MRYPDVLRAVIGYVPIPVRIDGFGRNAVLRLLDPAFDESGSGSRAVLRLGSDLLHLELREPNERLLYYASRNVLATYRRTPLGSLIRRLIRSPDDLFVDIGANLGVYSLLARQAGGTALLFEPEPKHLAFLQRNAHALGQVFPYALSDVNGSSEFYVAKSDKAGVSSLVNFEDGSEIYASSVQVPVRTFDEVAIANGVDPAKVKLIKVDVEGNEARTIRGMERFLGTGRAGAVWCEVRGPLSTRATNSCQDVIRVLRSVGYEPYLLRAGKARPFDPSRERLRRVFDLLFCRPGTIREGLG